MGHPMRLELTRVGLLVKVANHYTTKGGPIVICYCRERKLVIKDQRTRSKKAGINK